MLRLFILHCDCFKNLQALDISFVYLLASKLIILVQVFFNIALNLLELDNGTNRIDIGYGGNDLHILRWARRLKTFAEEKNERQLHNNKFNI